MQFWFTHDCDVPLRRQLATQFRLAILAGDIAPGQRLPSTRAFARRYHIHPNTVSAAYTDLQQEGWVESRRGSGVYARTQPALPDRRGSALQFHIAAFFGAMRELGFSAADLRDPMQAWLAAPPPHHFLLIDPDPRLRDILLAELRTFAPLPVREASVEACSDAKLFAAALPLCRPSKTATVRALLPATAVLTTLPINSATEWLAPLLSSAPNRLIVVLSHWRDFLDIARTMLTATGISPDALEFREVGTPGWQRGLGQASVVLTDAYTAASAKLPKGPHKLVFPVLAASTPDLLRTLVHTA